MGFGVRLLLRTAPGRDIYPTSASERFRRKAGRTSISRRLPGSTASKSRRFAPSLWKRCCAGRSDTGLIITPPFRAGAARTAVPYRAYGFMRCDPRTGVSFRHRMVCESRLRPGFCPLNPEARKLTDLRFLACVKAEFTAARELLNILGVVTLDEASIARLVMRSTSWQNERSRTSQRRYATSAHLSTTFMRLSRSSSGHKHLRKR